MTTEELRKAARKVLALRVGDDEGANHLLARLRHCGPEGERLRRTYLDAEQGIPMRNMRDFDKL